MNSIRQFLAILHINVTGFGQRPWPAMTIGIGITCSVGVLVAMLAMGTGARRQALGDAREDRVIVTSVDAQSTNDSNIPRDVARAITDMPGITKGASNKPVAVSEAIVIIEARRKTDGHRINLPLYGVTNGLTDLLPELHMTTGRMFQPGLREIIVSEACTRQYAGFEIGDKRSIRGGDWKVVGHFVQGHDTSSCLSYADGISVLSAFGRDSFNIVCVMLQSAAALSTFRAALTANPALHVEVVHERDSIMQDFKQFNGILNFVSYFVGTIMAIGATLGAVNSLYAMVDSRRRELATLRAIGFSSGPILASVIAESILLAIPGALLGSALAWLFFNGFSASVFGFTFQLAVTPSLVTLGIVWALIMGFAGGLLPALRAARVPVTTALRAT